MPQRQCVNTFLVQIPAIQLNTIGEFQIHTSVFASSSLLLGAFMRAGFHAFSVSRSFTSSFRESVICITGLLPFALPCWLFLFATGCYIQHKGLISSLFQSIHYHNIHLSKNYQQVNKATSGKCAECDYVSGMRLTDQCSNVQQELLLHQDWQLPKLIDVYVP